MTSAVAPLMIAALTLTGCTSEASSIGMAKNQEDRVVDTGFSVSTVGSYDSADTAVVLSIDAANKAVSLINMDTGKQYTLYYDGTTYVKDKYEGPMTISQIKAGDIVDVAFLKGKKKLASIQKSPKAWVYDNVSNYDLAGINRTASIGSQTYSLPAGVVVLSDGRRMGTEEVVSQDEVTISGIDHKIYSVNVDRGHGYLRLKNDQPLLGGWIEVGNRVIRQITEDMLITVPEGSYQVVLDNNGIGCVKEITVERDKEVLLDVGDVEIAEDKTGMILFEVTPASAKISVDGKPIDAGTAVELRYGIHQVVVEASGYDTLTKYIQVGSEHAAISFTLEETRKSSSSSVSDNTTERIPWQDTLDSVKPNSVSANDLSTLSQNALTTSNTNKVYVDSPKGVEVYLDGNYVGIAPVRFTKSPGRHEITLKKTGYQTKSYTIYLENNSRDETYSFSNLEKTSSSGSNSGNGNSSGNNDNQNPSGATTGTAPLPTDTTSDGTTETTSGTTTVTSSGETTTTPGDNQGESGTGTDTETGDGGSTGTDTETGGGDSAGTDTETGGESGTGAGTENGDGTDAGGETGTGDQMTTQQFTIRQESHPIRDFFSSLFKRK
ncbi:MAG: PEGA domain-containing protein [Bacteroidales bacterium]|nr:PEGA domain-containing protein [Bacteroidales bacterium]MCM1416154.1 PEGA domain-containing protein [bacterium]MCM1422741.1 PEGA domain-containing protein [bacterium]